MRAGGLTMAVSALQLGVATHERKTGLPGMIEGPQRPTIGRVATLAFLAQPAFVHVLTGMALRAGGGCTVERQRCMTLRTTDNAV